MKIELKAKLNNDNNITGKDDTSCNYQSKELIEKIKKDNYNNWQNQKGISEPLEPHEDWKKRKRLGIKYISDVVTAPQLIKHLDGKRIATVGGLKLITDFSKLAKDINAIYIRDFIPEETDIIVASNIYFDDFIKNNNFDIWKDIKINFPDMIIIRESEFLKSLGFKVPKSECKGESNVNELENYTVIDLETTDKNAKTCEIIELAAVKIRNNEIFDTFSTLVKPNNKIPYIVTQTNNITNEMVENAPVINDVFKEYLDFIGDDIVLGHNINAYDMPIIRRYCEQLNSNPLNNNTLDTLRFSRKCDIDVPNFRLTTLTEYFEIEHKNAHRALADCIANHECYQKMKKLYDPLNAPKVIKNKTSDNHKRNKRLSEETLRLKELNDMVNDIIADNVLTDKKINLLSNWLNANQHLSGNYSFDKVNNAVSSVLEGGIITDDEKTYLLSVLSNYNDPIEFYYGDLKELNIDGKQIVLTGDFIFGTRSEVTAELESFGADVKSSVSGKTDFVIVGAYGSEDWAGVNYGSKIKKAIELQSKGNDIKIMKEENFFKCLKRSSIVDIIASINAEIINTHNTPPDFFVVKENKDSSQSVWIKEPLTQMIKKLVFNYKSGKKHTFLIKKGIIDSLQIPSNAELRERKSDTINYYISFDDVNEEMLQFIKDVSIYYVNNFEPSDKFGCCSKYKECSAAGKCLHDNLFYSEACWYRKNLESGKIFY